MKLICSISNQSDFTEIKKTEAGGGKEMGQSESLQEQTVGSWRLEDRLHLWLSVHPEALLKGPLSMQEPSRTHRDVLAATLYYCHCARISQGLINNCTRCQ